MPWGRTIDPPQPVTPDSWHELPQTGVRVESPDAPSLAAWWTTLNDPQLNEFIERALADNKTAKQAYARVVQARAQRAIAGSGFWPNIGASASASRSESESNFNESGEVVSTVGESYNTGLSASWELDLFGGQRRSYEAATAQLAATEADLRDVLVVLLGDVALSYVGVRTAQSRLDFAERNLESQREALDITRWRAEAGLTTVLDVEQANTSYEQTRAQIPLLESSLVQNMNRLAVLTGQDAGRARSVVADVASRFRSRRSISSRACPPMYCVVVRIFAAPSDSSRRRRRKLVSRPRRCIQACR